MTAGVVVCCFWHRDCGWNDDSNEVDHLRPLYWCDGGTRSEEEVYPGVNGNKSNRTAFVMTETQTRAGCVHCLLPRLHAVTHSLGLGHHQSKVLRDVCAIDIPDLKTVVLAWLSSSIQRSVYCNSSWINK